MKKTLNRIEKESGVAQGAPERGATYNPVLLIIAIIIH